MFFLINTLRGNAFIHVSIVIMTAGDVIVKFVKAVDGEEAN